MTSQYPRWKHHKTLPSRLVADPDQEMALGPDWHDTPQRPMHAAKPRCPHCAAIEEQFFELQQRSNAVYGEVAAERDRLLAENAQLKLERDRLLLETQPAPAPKAAEKRKTRLA